RLHKLLRLPFRSPGHALLTLLVLALVGVGAYVAGWNQWARYHFRAADRAADRGDFARARAHLALCLEVWPGDAETYYQAARAARRGGDFPDAERQLARCEELSWPAEAVELERALARAQRGDLIRVEGYL